MLIPPQSPVLWTHTAEEVLTLATEAVESDRRTKDKIAALQEGDCNFETVSTPSYYVLESAVTFLR